MLTSISFGSSLPFAVWETAASETSPSTSEFELYLEPDLDLGCRFVEGDEGDEGLLKNVESFVCPCPCPCGFWRCFCRFEDDEDEARERVSVVNFRLAAEVGFAVVLGNVGEEEEPILRFAACWDKAVTVIVCVGVGESMAVTVLDDVEESCDTFGGSRLSSCKAVAERPAIPCDIGAVGHISGIQGIDEVPLEEAGVGHIGSPSSPFLPKNFINSICFPEYSAQNLDAILGGSRFPSEPLTPSKFCNLSEQPSRLGSGISSRRSR